MVENERRCLHCQELIKQNWKVCPNCETPLSALACPQCGEPVKEHWKICPECETALVGSKCAQRMSHDHTESSACFPVIPKTTEQIPIFTEPQTGMEFIFVQGGKFMMGDTFGDGVKNEKPVHEVELDGFYIGKYPVTQKQWKTIMGVNPSRFKGDSHPVEQVAWNDVTAFIHKLDALHQGKYRFSLPSEAQWEFAARSGGKSERYAGGDNVDAVAWYVDNSDERTHPVGQKAPNGIGVYDMSGNVWEWCVDVFKQDAYKTHESKNPVYHGKELDRVIRGGSWNIDAWSVRCARRFGFSVDFFAPGLGVRLVINTG